MNKNSGLIAALSLLGSAWLAPVALAQTVDDQNATPSMGLNLPSDLSGLGRVDPKLRKPTVVINGEIITGTDVDHRLALVLLANGGKVDEAEKERLRLQVFRNLIDETLQIQEAKANKIEVARAEIDQSFNRVAANFKRTPDQLDGYLRSSGSSARTMRRQIEGEMAWSRLIRRNIDVNVSDAEVNEYIARLNADRGKSEYRVSEIYLSATPETLANVSNNMQQIVDKLKQGASFVAYARQFSEASTAVQGGDLGWVRAAVLPDSMAQAVQTMQPGQLVGPVEVPGGLSLIYLADVRQVLMADPRDATLALRQLSLPVPAGTSKDQLEALVKSFGEATEKMGGCGGAEGVAKQFGAEVVDNELAARELPPQLQQALLTMQVGESTTPFGSVEDGVRVLTLCGRDEPPVESGVDPDNVRSKFENERLSKRAQILLRDLRRDAVIEFK